MVKNKDLKRKILDIAYKNKLSHLGSYFSSVDIIDDIFQTKSPEDIFILSNGHASLALYVVLEKYYISPTAEELFKFHGGHPKLNHKHRIYCSTGSLGMGITVGIGRAIGNQDRTVHVMISDGECAEGSVWESLRFIEDNKLNNIKIHVNVNGYAAYDEIDINNLKRRLEAFNTNNNIIIYNTTSEHFSFLKGLNAHYHIMKESDYHLAIKELE